MGKKAHLQVFVWFRIKIFLDCRRIWLTLDGEERNVAQRCLQFVSDSMEVSTVEQIVGCKFLFYSSMMDKEGVPQPRSQGFSVRTRGETRKPWSGPVTCLPKKWQYLTATRQGVARYSLMKYTRKYMHAETLATE